jgi:hypothetical protein
LAKWLRKHQEGASPRRHGDPVEHAVRSVDRETLVVFVIVIVDWRWGRVEKVRQCVMLSPDPADPVVRPSHVAVEILGLLREVLLSSGADVADELGRGL